jgi:hypothetical protein
MRNCCSWCQSYSSFLNKWSMLVSRSFLVSCVFSVLFFPEQSYGEEYSLLLTLKIGDQKCDASRLSIAIRSAKSKPKRTMLSKRQTKSRLRSSHLTKTHYMYFSLTVLLTDWYWVVSSVIDIYRVIDQSTAEWWTRFGKKSCKNIHFIRKILWRFLICEKFSSQCMSSFELQNRAWLWGSS